MRLVLGVRSCWCVAGCRVEQLGGLAQRVLAAAFASWGAGCRWQMVGGGLLLCGPVGMGRLVFRGGAPPSGVVQPLGFEPPLDSKLFCFVPGAGGSTAFVFAVPGGLLRGSASRAGGCGAGGVPLGLVDLGRLVVGWERGEEIPFKCSLQG